MYYFLDALNGFVASFLFAFVFRRAVTGFLCLAIYLAVLQCLNFSSSSIFTMPLYWQYEAAVAILTFVLFELFRRKIVQAFEANGSFITSRITFKLSDRRYVLIGQLWLFTVLMTTTMAVVRERDAFSIPNDFFISWLVNDLFFTIVGLAAALVSLRLPHEEEFKSRVGFLVAPMDADPQFRSTVLEHLAGDIKKLGFVSSSTERKITIEEYSAEYDAYRAYVTVHTTLVNLFGDVDAKDDTNFQVTPDKFLGDRRPPIVGEVVSLIVEGEERIRERPLPIDFEVGVKFTEPFSVGRESKSYVFKYWAWFRTDEMVAYSTRRYCRRFTVRIVNRMRVGQGVVATLMKIPEGTRSELPRTLRYGEEVALIDIDNMEPNRVYSLFKFITPETVANPLNSTEDSTILNTITKS
ncbi:hypothetical protein ACQZ4R_13080 [Agrobacterium vitis]